VIGLTNDLIVVMETKDVDIIVQLLDIDTSPLLHVTSDLDTLQVKLESICDTKNRYAVLRFGITLTTTVVPQPLEVQNYNWYIMPEGGAYVWDAWRSTRQYNPSLVMFVKQQADYGSNEGRSGRPTVLDHPLHIALFEGNFRQYQPPHLRTMANQPRLLPPLALTLVYPQRMHTVLRRSH
jgi:hypothetical protein